MLCSNCGRPKATSADVIRWRTIPTGYGDVCWVGFDHSWLYPDEEVIEGPGVALLKERLINTRIYGADLGCCGLGAIRRAGERR